MMLAMMAMVFTFSACGSDDEESGSNFNYPMEYLYGRWDLTELSIDGKTIDLSNSYWYKFKASATFNSDGTYSGSGYFGNGSGTYKATGNTVITYINGKEYLRYILDSVTPTKMSGYMTQEGSTEKIGIKAEKKN